MKIIFFQHFHNGDVFCSKEYVRQLSEHGFDLGYLHYNHPDILYDINVRYLGTPETSQLQLDKSLLMLTDNDTLYVNTWLSAYHKSRIIDNLKSHINYTNLNYVWQHIFNKINDLTNSQLKVHDPEYYVPEIEHKNIVANIIDSYFFKIKGKKILICNNQPMSQQSFNSDMKSIIEDLSIKFLNWNFICTKKFNTSRSNIHFSDDIIPNLNIQSWNPRAWGRKNFDLNEISYLSNSCDIIVGKNSGPFIFCMTKNNVFDSRKKIISFNRHFKDSLLHDIKYKANYIYSRDFSEPNIKKIIESQLIDSNL